MTMQSAADTFGLTQAIRHIVINHTAHIEPVATAKLQQIL